ncbi:MULTISPECIES: hypothetical protein [Prochlorococcus]|uniref:Uncharacterized protein n=1 Tax=Prochlorococcus marinus str. MIT 9116 TaxID=167544 RepID=A0A0A1ZLG4_PROMR|nr:hypothetical protein [Prochlorococcus marinus]KGF89544.1 hypothetical protein EU92_1332 [Prochlorococcus marinus str. MIT 9107]KGF90447.1 hypothetical protein EU93_1618 [Prochlorococcus marinus str. MIT 9116]KGF92926.1 hypothetical protein EU94_1928 [Prochlorococcus marinus str. MIT 9123]
MPSQRKRIGFLPSEEVQDIIDKLCKDNKFSQSKLTGLLVEEALRSRGVLRNSFNPNSNDKNNFINNSFEEKYLSKNNKIPRKSDLYSFNKHEFSDDIKMMHEFIEFKYFKKVMKQNNNIFE